jgi:uncharacterized protein (UPF0332 family)
MELLNEADILYEVGSYKSSNNRAYYAAFNGVRALLALDGVDFKKHSAVIQYFIRLYIKTGELPIEFSDIIISASKIRNNSDYDDFFIASKEMTKTQINKCKELCHAINEYLHKRISNNAEPLLDMEIEKDK